MDRDPLPIPRAARIPSNNEAILVTGEGDDIPVMIADVSAGGFRLVTSETLYDGENIFVGEEVTVQPARGDKIRARIMWAHGCEAGCVFLDPADSL